MAAIGNYVVSEALKRENAQITTYIATLAASESESWMLYFA